MKTVKNYNEIWKKVRNLIEKECYSNPVNNDKKIIMVKLTQIFRILKY